MRVVNNTFAISPRAVSQSGFSLFELMITLLVVSVGLVGLAGLQAMWLKINSRAYHVSQATVQAYDIADRMRTNAVKDTVACAGSGTSTEVWLPQANYSTMSVAEAIAAGVQEGCSSQDGCTAAQLAQNDLREWGTELAAVLPRWPDDSPATGSIALTAANCVYTYTITVNWFEDLDGDSVPDNPNLQISFQLSFDS